MTNDHSVDTEKMVPLTIEQLREMGGKPYWHVGLQDDSPKPHWKILDQFVANHPEDYGYGKRWLAYAYHHANIDREAFEKCCVCQKYKEILFRGYRTRKEAVEVSRNSNPHISGSARFCPRCGRPLTPEAWDELEKRLGVKRNV